MEQAGKKLADRVLLISGGSRGIGLAIALRAARDGASIVLVAKTAQPHPKLQGTVYTAAQAIEEAGGRALPIVGDVRDDADIDRAVTEAISTFGRIDICVNNASAIDLAPVGSLPMKRFDLMHDINVRGTYALSQAAVEHLARGTNPHILTLSPPLDLDPKWLAPHTAYTMAKYAMSLCALGLAEQLRPLGIASNTLWPRTLIATAAVQNLLGGDDAMRRSRTPAIYADAAYYVLTRDSRECTGNSFLCEDVLRDAGVSDLSAYNAAGSDSELATDFYVDAVNPAESAPAGLGER